jgi:D-serine deaminase-like pyridoxal phosphate-dependent protein
MRRLPTSVADLETPVALVDLDALTTNVDAMASHARALDVRLRPHVKTHKCIEIAELQRDAGTSGFTVATLHEAERLADAGFDDLLLAYPPVGDWRIRRIERLLSRARVTFLLDGPDAAAALDRLGCELGTPLPCLWEIDCGARRSGTQPGAETVAAVERALGGAGVELAGFLTFPGHVYGSRTEADVLAAVGDEEDAVGRTLAAAAGSLAVGTLSGGTTPTTWRARADAPFTELRPGNYVFHDASQVTLGVVGYERCALTVGVTVVSRPTAQRVVVDAGSKALGRELMTPNAPGYGVVAGRPRLAVTAVHEEHGVIEAGADVDVSDLRVGDRLELVPNHACVTANLHAAYVLRRGEAVEGVVPLAARGWSAG